MDLEQNNFNPKFRFNKIFFGWFIVATMVAVTFAQTALYNPALSVFLKPITEEFGWSRSVFAGAITVGTILGGFLALVVGPILDKKGSKAVLFFWLYFFWVSSRIDIFCKSLMAILYVSRYRAIHNSRVAPNSPRSSGFKVVHQA